MNPGRHAYAPWPCMYTLAPNPAHAQGSARTAGYGAEPLQRIPRLRKRPVP